ncbi:MAG: outer membrane beta-barrel protein [Terracidiphilus sp.]|jgi:opacity protein-like surface antigen
MRFKLLVLPVLAVSILTVAIPALSQTVPAYQRQDMPLFVGIGPSGYDVDWGHGRMYGGTIWADWYPERMPSVLHGLGVEVEARDISLDRHLPPQLNIRQDTAGGGLIYAWRHFRNFHPYAKFLIEQGSYDFTTPSPTYSHDTRALWAPGAGFEYRLYHAFWARADYEYQTWQTLLGKTPNPEGFTVGVSYNFAYPYPNKR